MAHAGMLRASCESNDIEIDMRVVVDPDRSCAVAHYRELIDFADALLEGNKQNLNDARERLRVSVGDQGLARAAAVVGNFQMMNRALEAVGATFGDKLPSRVKTMAQEFGLEPPPHWPSS